MGWSSLVFLLTGLSGSLWWLTVRGGLVPVGGIVDARLTTGGLAVLLAVLVWRYRRPPAGVAMPWRRVSWRWRAVHAAVLGLRCAALGLLLGIVIVGLHNGVRRPLTRVLIDWDRPLHIGDQVGALVAGATALWESRAPAVTSGDAELDALLASGSATRRIDAVRARLADQPSLAERLRHAEAELAGTRGGEIHVFSVVLPNATHGWQGSNAGVHRQWHHVGGGLTTEAAEVIQPLRLRLPNDPIVASDARLTVALPAGVDPGDVRMRIGDAEAEFSGAIEAGEYRAACYAVSLPSTWSGELNVEVLGPTGRVARQRFDLAPRRLSVDDRVGLLDVVRGPAADEEDGPLARAPAAVGDLPLAWLPFDTVGGVGCPAVRIRFVDALDQQDARLRRTPAFARTAYGAAGVWVSSSDGLPRLTIPESTGDALVSLSVPDSNATVPVLYRDAVGGIVVALPRPEVLAALTGAQQHTFRSLLLLASAIALRDAGALDGPPVISIGFDESEGDLPLVLGPPIPDDPFRHLLSLLVADRTDGRGTPANSARGTLAAAAVAVLIALCAPAAFAALRRRW